MDKFTDLVEEKTYIKGKTFYSSVLGNQTDVIKQVQQWKKKAILI